MSTTHRLTRQQATMLDFLGTRIDDYYLMIEAFVVHGPLDPMRLRQSVDRAVRRHGALRMRFPETNGEYVVDDYDPAAIEAVMKVTSGHPGIEAALAACAEDVSRPMDLTRELPLRVRAAQVDDETWALVVAGHHLVFDGWSFKLLYAELASGYDEAINHFDSRPVPAQYWEAVLADEERARRRTGSDAADWSGLLDRPYAAIRKLHGAVATPKGPAAVAGRTFDTDVHVAVTKAAAAHRVTPYVVGTSAFLRALGDVLETPEVIVGSAFAGRLSGKSAEAIGYFSTTAFIGAADVHALPVDQLVRQVNALVARWHAVPRQQWEDLLARHAGVDLYPVKFSFERAAVARPDARFEGVRVERVASTPGTTARRPLDAQVLVHDGFIEFHARYRTDVIDAAWMDQLIDRFGAELATIDRTN